MQRRLELDTSGVVGGAGHEGALRQGVIVGDVPDVALLQEGALGGSAHPEVRVDPCRVEGVGAET